VVEGRTVDSTGVVSVDVLKAFLDAFNRHDLDGIMTFFGDHPVFDFPRGPHDWGSRAEGRNEVRRLLATRFEGIPNVHYGDDRHFVCGPRGVSEWLLTGTASDGKEIRVRGCDLFEFEGGKIARKDSYWKIVE
jgi:ketosteroid isomerase-like protein